MARLQNFERKIILRGFRAVLFRMVPKHLYLLFWQNSRFRAVLFRMVPKLKKGMTSWQACFRAVLFRMVPKPLS